MGLREALEDPVLVFIVVSFLVTTVAAIFHKS